MNHQSLSAFIWSVADLLRGDYKQSEYGRVILPFTVLRRLDCVLAPTKEAVLEAAGKGHPDPMLLRASQTTFFNRSPLDLVKLVGDQDNIATNLLSYVQGFSPEVRASAPDRASHSVFWMYASRQYLRVWLKSMASDSRRGAT